MITVTRYHDISCGHRVVGHEGKCRHLHGHNYRIHFYLTADKLDDLNRVMDFGLIKTVLCNWLEEKWDHKFLIWREDPVLNLHPRYPVPKADEVVAILDDSFVVLPFNPTAEALAQHLLEVVCPTLLRGYQVTVISVKIEETRKCNAQVFLDSF